MFRKKAKWILYAKKPAYVERLIRLQFGSLKASLPPLMI